MSLTATAIKLVRFGSFPSMLVYYENGERKWFIPSAEDLPKKLWPSKQPDKGTLTARLISGGTNEEGPEDVRADKWFDVHNSDRYYIRESCFRNGPDSVIAILWWEDEAQIIDLEEEEERNACPSSQFCSALKSTTSESSRQSDLL